MNIILEGPDNSGKSTLANVLLQVVPYTLQSGEGPPKFPWEIDERANRYMAMKNTIFDRHPCISETIYGKYRGKPVELHRATMDRFGELDHLIIYCESDSMGAHDHEVKDHDTPDHLELIHDHDKQIRQDYRIWAAVNAHAKYRIGDDVEAVKKLVMEFHNAQSV